MLNRLGGFPPEDRSSYTVTTATVTLKIDDNIHYGYRAGHGPVNALDICLAPVPIIVKSIEQTEFFKLPRTHTIMGFLAAPEWGGNQGDGGLGSHRHSASTTEKGTDPLQTFGCGGLRGDRLGAAGGVAAKELSTAGFSVVVLEQGAYVCKREAFLAR